MSDDNVVVRLVPLAERQAKEEQAYLDEAHAEALSMLDRARKVIEEHGGRVTGLAISIAWEDGSYGRLIPVEMCHSASLIGSVGTTHHDLILRTLTDHVD